MSRTLEERIRDWALWFHKNKDRIPPADLQKRCDFLEKAVDGCLECIAIATKDVQELEGSKPGANLWLPRGITYTDDDGKTREFKP